MEDHIRVSTFRWKSYFIPGLVGLAVGLYLIGTTVVIAADGALYIGKAQQFTVHFGKAIRGTTPGYPLLIYLSHRIFCPDSVSTQSWIWAAQGVTLACRIAACLVLYGIARRWIGPARSMMAVLTLLLLPYPSRFGADVMRDWPYLLFLVLGMGALLTGCRRQRPVWLIWAGLFSGIAYLIRVEGAQVVLLGLIALGVEGWVRSTRQPRRRLVLAGALLLAGFCVGGGWQMALRGQILPDKLRFVEANIEILEPDNKNQWIDPVPILASISSSPRWSLSALFGAPWMLLKQTSECMSPHFLALGLIGLAWAWKRTTPGTQTRFWIALWGGFQIIMLIYLYSSFGYLSRRHTLAPVAALCLVVPAGAEILVRRFAKGTNPAGLERMVWIVMAAAMAMNLPKLSSPLRKDKSGYRQVSQWLADHTTKGTRVIVDDPRIALYADRPYALANRYSVIPARYPYLILHQEGKAKPPNVLPGWEARKAYSAATGSSEDSGSVVVYRIVRVVSSKQRKTNPQTGGVNGRSDGRPSGRS